MYNEQLETLINAALADGVLSEKEKQILFKRAQSLGIDLDEFEMVLDAKLLEIKKTEKEQASKSAPKSNKYGDVRKCPVCGSLVPPLAAVCTDCGYEFIGIDANLSSQKLADLLLETTDINKQKVIIETFPIPLSKADLFEFLTSLLPRMKDVKHPLSSSYFKKYQECIVKAKASFAEDASIKPFIESYDKDEKQIKRALLFEAIKKWCSEHKKLTFFILFVLICVILSAIDSIISAF